MGEDYCGVFLLEEEDHGGSRRPEAHPDDALMAAHLNFLLRRDAQTAQVARDVELCSLRLSLQTGRELCSPQELAAALHALGHTVSVLTSAGGGTGIAAFRNLRHTFLTVAPPPNPPQLLPSSGRAGGVAAAAAAAALDWAVGGCPGQQDTEEGEEEEEELCEQLLLCGDPAGCSEHTVIVDPHFKCQFVLASPSPRFAALHRLLPQTFVGSRAQLEDVVDWLSREMHWSFKEAQQALPPWREQGAMLSKWKAAPAGAACQPGGSGGSPSACSSPRGPAAACCCCCDGGGAAAAAGGSSGGAAAAPGPAGPAGGNSASGQLSPSSVLRPALPAFLPAAASHGQHSMHAAQQARSSGMASSSSSTPVTPTHHHRAGGDSGAAGGMLPAPRVSLLSRSLEAAGLPARMRRAGSMPPASRTQQQQQQQQQVPWWELQPRTIIVRRSS